MAYFTASTSILRLPGKVSFLEALHAYKLESTIHLQGSSSGTPYSRRKQAETVWEMTRRGIVSETLELCPVPTEEGVQLPSNCDYESLSFGPLKTLVASYRRVRYSRESFRFNITQEQLAKDADLSQYRLREALRQLTQRSLIWTEKIWRKGKHQNQETRITLLDPELPSGVPIFHIAEFYRDGLEAVPIPDRYRECLARYDPRGQLKDIFGPVTGHQVICPFCPKPDPKGTLRFDSTETDRWHCFKCKRSGDSARLWARLRWRSGKDNWRSILAQITNAPDARMEVEEQQQ